MHVTGRLELRVVGLSRAQVVLGQLSSRRQLPPSHSHRVPVASLSKTHWLACCPRRLVTEITNSRGLLSWSSSKTAPPPTSPCASTLGFPRFGFATPEHVPPLSFFPTSVVYSAHGLQVCCTLLPVMGFAWFRADRRLSPAPDPPPRRPTLRSSSPRQWFSCRQESFLRVVGPR